MIGFALGWVAGAILGAVVAFGLLRKRALAGVSPDPETHESTNADRESAAGEIEAHARRVHEGLSEYADLLAGEDSQLRLHLRRFEGASDD